MKEYFKNIDSDEVILTFLLGLIVLIVTGMVIFVAALLVAAFKWYLLLIPVFIVAIYYVGKILLKMVPNIGDYLS